jgi:hypothetical protein
MLCLSMTKSGTSVGVGVTDSGSVGVGGALTGSMTELARKFTPGPAPTATAENGCGGCLVLLALVLLVASFGDHSEYFLFALLAAGGAVALFMSGKSITARKRTAWLEKVKMYEHGWICFQCGQAWIIPEVDSSQKAVVP